MAQLTRDDILKLAQLARLGISPDEAESLSSEISSILDYVALLDDVDVAGLSPTTQVTGLQNVTRPDVIKDYGYTPGELLRNVPEVESDQIKVKRMVG